MTIFLTALSVALYVIGFIGLHVMSRDFSDLPRSRKTWISLCFWPFAVLIGLIGDLYDVLSSANQEPSK